MSKLIFRFSVSVIFIFVSSFGLTGCIPYIIGIGGGPGHTSSHVPRRYPPRRISRNVEVGIASWYGPGFQGRPTASGQIYNMYNLTAASRTLPLNSYAYVTNLGNHRSVEVYVNDRGPYYGGRIMDLSYAAARAIGMIGAGTALVRIQYLGPKPVVRNIVRSYSGRHAHHVFGYMLQFAAYTKKTKAVSMIKRMMHIVPGVHMITRTVRGVFYYKVVFGKFKNVKDAYNFAKIITKYGYDVYVTKIG